MNIELTSEQKAKVSTVAILALDVESSKKLAKLINENIENETASINKKRRDITRKRLYDLTSELFINAFSR